LPIKAEDFFNNGYCIQTTAVTAQSDTKSVRAYVEKKWHNYPLVKYPKAFVDWNIDRRLRYLEVIRQLMKGESQVGPELARPHNGIVATYGYNGKTSHFKLNNAVKGMGFLPKATQIESVINLLKSTADSPMSEKLDILTGMFEDAETLFDMDRQVSLELYADSKFLTQTFANQMLNPVSTIVFLDIPSFKLKTITRLLSPKNPNLTDYEKQVVDYVNIIHSYFHGKFDQEFIAVIYYVVEVYDNSPGCMDARGQRIVL
jgi:hypothetical protein